ncbi:MAG: shikimate kinase, partial [Alphaproteobacteria bacterium]|nr:shikimate kinase [Alphaproteobacteria bacterium]MDX5369502.1 shikimate kinase [Alphaproteobacteria bacterium]MDX5464160.1 shikimate kinase [Alphaproteobacteria bacterium]
MTQDALYARLKAALPPDRSIVLVGLMGAGKSSIGRRLAKRLDLPFSDADAEIEQAAGQSVADIFAAHGEEGFREGERKVIARLLAERHGVLATGGGAFMSAETRARIAERGISVWLKA